MYAHDVLDTTAIDVQDEGTIGVDAFASQGIGLGLARDLAESVDTRLRLAAPSPTTFRLLIPDHTAGPQGRAVSINRLPPGEDG